MKRSGFKWKPRKPLKRTSFKQKLGGSLKRRKLRVKGVSDTATVKQEIQDILREGVIKRDGGCILQKYRYCEDPVLQADHLITRANSATYADIRLVVCLCRSCHGWKHYHKEEYDFLVKSILNPKTVDLWKRCEEASWKPQRTSVTDWKLELAALKQLVKNL